MKKTVSVLVIILIYLTSFNLFSQDTLKYNVLQGGVKQLGNFTFYQCKDGSLYKIGDKVKIGTPSSNKTFAFIVQGDGLLIPITPLTAASSGEQTEIKKIAVGGNKRIGFKAGFRTKGLTGLSNYSIDIENAIATGEVQSSGMTSDEALNELKRTKDKLDLGLITQEEYDRKKAELVKYIK